MLLIATLCETLQTKILQKVAAETTSCSLFAIVRGGMVCCWFFDTWAASSRLALMHRLSWQLFLATFSESQIEMSCLREVEMVSYLSIHLFSKMADWRHYLVLFAWVPGVRKKEHHNSRAFKTTGCAQSVHNKRHMFRSVARLDALTSKSSVLARNYTDEISYWIAYYFNSWTDIDRF